MIQIESFQLQSSFKVDREEIIDEGKKNVISVCYQLCMRKDGKYISNSRHSSLVSLSPSVGLLESFGDYVDRFLSNTKRFISYINEY